MMYSETMEDMANVTSDGQGKWCLDGHAVQIGRGELVEVDLGIISVRNGPHGQIV